MDAKNPDQGRIVSLDQFRGYTVAGMLLVNFVGGYLVIQQHLPVLKHHNTYCSYADTIMPQFFFAVGFAYRLTLLRRLKTVGARTAYAHALRRSLGLILLGVVLYHLDGRAETWEKLQQLGWLGLLQACKRTPFQTLVHIGVTSIWVIPVIAAGPAARIAFAVGSGVLHAYLSYGLSWPLGVDWSAYTWVFANPAGIDGGPLGFLTWTIPLLVGSLAYDMVAARPERPPVGRLFVWGVLIMALGYGLSCLNRVTPPNAAGPDFNSWLVEPPFVPPTAPVNMWTMSQRAGSVSYLTFGAGFSLAVYALFALACDVGRLRVGLFATFGSNALAAYIIHDLVAEAVKPYAPSNSPAWFVAAAFGLFLGVSYLFVHHLEKNRIFLRM